MNPASTTSIGIDDVDPAILSTLENQDELVSVKRLGNSADLSTYLKLETRNESRLKAYFVKVKPPESRSDFLQLMHHKQIIEGENAYQRATGEFRCMSEISEVMPSLVPSMRGTGKCSKSEDAYFVISDFIKIDHRQPDAVRVAERIVELHQKSVSPTGQFGFHDEVVLFDARLCLFTKWHSNWTVFFGRLLKGVYQGDIERHGVWNELDDVMNITFDKLIPRLIGALEANGRYVKPCLIHGDLWEKNIGTDTDTGEIYIFDANGLYAHHEMGLSHWRTNIHKMDAEEYRIEYFKRNPPSEPKAECDDRLKLYGVKEMLVWSAHARQADHPGHKYRRWALGTLRELIGKYVQSESYINPD